MKTVAMIRRLYSTFECRHAQARELLGRPLALAEKILFSHMPETGDVPPVRGKTYLTLAPDRVAMQDATAQMALLQFMLARRDRVAVPTTVHCDHLIRAEMGASEDLEQAEDVNREVYDFLSQVSKKYGIGFWKPGAGIIHQVVLENYAFPGGMMIGTDSHTPNAGGMGMVAIGVGGADACDVIAGMPWGVRCPRLIGVRLNGSLSGWTAPKDVILKLAGILSVKGGTGAIVEYFGEGTRSLSCTGKATITNMGAEIGATTSLFPYDRKSADFLKLTGREEEAALAEQHSDFLRADPEVEEDPGRFFDRIIEIDLSNLEPHIVGPHTPDLARPISRLREDVEKNGYPAKLSAALIGSCTNSSYEDMGRAAHIARQAREAGISAKVPFMVTPGSTRVHDTIARDGQLGELAGIGATVLANACGPCIGQWKRRDAHDTDNSIVTSFNRNFRRRNDGDPGTRAFIASPEMVTALALAGRLDFNPMTDKLVGISGEELLLEAPTADELPEMGFVDAASGFVPPSEDGCRVEISVAPDSERLELLTPFAAWDGNDLEGLVVLLKARGKCTTDHISAAGPWLKFRGHLDRISDNMFLGANNAWAEKPGHTVNVFTGEVGRIPAVARDYKARGVGWISVGDENYGEGSSREHAAMSPRHLGCRAVLVRSFARIHETNLKKQGVLPLTFADPADYERITSVNDRMSVIGLAGIAPEKPLTVVVNKSDGEEVRFQATHTLTAGQIEWFEKGSALNCL